jgi:hypothetical protein
MRVTGLTYSRPWSGSSTRDTRTGDVLSISCYAEGRFDGTSASPGLESTADFQSIFDEAHLPFHLTSAEEQNASAPEADGGTAAE